MDTGERLERGDLAVHWQAQPAGLSRLLRSALEVRYGMHKTQAYLIEHCQLFTAQCSQQR